jgi:mxaJ protein
MIRSVVICLVAATLGIAVAPQVSARELRICADPNNLPFSNQRRQGFENRIAELLAAELRATPRYTWWAQRRGYVRNTLKAGACDLVPGVASGVDMLRTTQPYYRSSYQFVTRADRHLDITSLDDPRLRSLTVGVQMIGDDGANSPPAHALARRGIVDNVRGYMLYGDYRQASPPQSIIRAVGTGEVDVAIAWGPMAGYFSARSRVPLKLVPVSPSLDGPQWPMAFDISMGVRRDDQNLRQEIDAALTRRQADVRKILEQYHVPLPDDG